MVLGCALLTANDAIMKWVTPEIGVTQAVLIRSALLMLPLMLIVAREKSRYGVRVQRYGLQCLRGLLTAAGVFLFVTSLTLLPLADAIAITFASPLIVTALAPMLLGELVGWRRRLAVAVGFGGVLIMLRPGSSTFSLAALLPLTVAVIEAARDILNRTLVRTESTAVTVLISNAAVCLAAIAASAGALRVPAPDLLLLLAASALCMGGAQLLMMEAFRHGEAALVSPYHYSALVWAVIIGVVAFGDWPDAWMISGCIVVVGSGLYILHREMVTAKARRQSSA